MPLRAERLRDEKKYFMDDDRHTEGRTANHPYKPEHQISDGIFITEGL